MNRLLHANGVDLEDLGVGRESMSEEDNRNAFRILCEHWRDFAGTAMRYWLVDQLVGIFGVTERPSVETADHIYDAIAEHIAQPDFRPRALMDSFDIVFIATTDDPCDDLDGHARLAADETFTRRVAPTFRPDKYLEPAAEGWTDLLAKLSEVSGYDATTLDGFTAAMETRRAYFKDHGAVSSDHSHRDLGTVILGHDRAATIFADSVAGQATVEEMTLLRRHLFTDQARMASEDGLTMTVHPAVHRNHDTSAFRRFGADIGLGSRRLPALVARQIWEHRPQAGHLHDRRDPLFAGNRSAGRLVPQPLHRSALVVHRRPRVGEEVQARHHGDGWVQQGERHDRRHSRLLLDSCTPRHESASGCRPSRRTGGFRQA